MVNLEEFIKINKTSCVVEDASFNFETEYSGIKAIYYSVGKNKVFAFIGVPDTPKPLGGYPAVVLVHGGDGCAYYEWVKKWTDKGFVAIAPDFNANYAIDKNNRRVGNLLGGPKGYGSFNQIDSDCPWTFFSVLSIISAVDLLSSRQDVDCDKISLCGLSWGGVVSLIALSQEKRFKSAVIIYSSGYILDTDFFLSAFNRSGCIENDKDFYNRFFDPQAYLKEINIPILFIAGADDVAFTMQSRKKTTDNMTCEKFFSYRKNLPHGHSAGWSCKEAINFILSKLQKLDYPTLEVSSTGDKLKILSKEKIINCQLVYTQNCFNTVKGEWDSVEICGDAVDFPQ